MLTLPLHFKSTDPQRPPVRPARQALLRRGAQVAQRLKDRTALRFPRQAPPAVRPDPDLTRWATVGVKRTVVVAVHTMTSLMRLEDMTTLLEGDPRIQLVYTQVPDRLGQDVEQRLRDMQVRTVPWEQAGRSTFDLAIGASLHQMENLPATARIAAPHGAGFTKLWPKWAWPGPSDDRPVYGLDRDSLVDPRGAPIFDALILPHAEHLATLEKQCPESLPAAVLAGDPCYDRLLGCLAGREHYRYQLGVREGQVLVAVTSTWGANSLLATRRELLMRLTSELPVSHRVIATLHPAVWAEHGYRQVRSWLWEARSAGIDLIDAGEDWRGLLAAADLLIADHSSLGVYGAGVRLPLLLSHFPAEEVDGNSVVTELAEVSPRLAADTPLYTQLVAARAARDAQFDVARRRISGATGMSAELIRKTLYDLLELPEPVTPARWPAVPAPRLVRDPAFR